MSLNVVVEGLQQNSPKPRTMAELHVREVVMDGSLGWEGTLVVKFHYYPPNPLAGFYEGMVEFTYIDYKETFDEYPYSYREYQYIHNNVLEQMERIVH